MRCAYDYKLKKWNIDEQSVVNNFRVSAEFRTSNVWIRHGSVQLLMLKMKPRFSSFRAVNAAVFHIPSIAD
jgi:hypothetical protein